MTIPSIQVHTREIRISLQIGAVVALVAGYADLARGGTTISAFLLALAYCGLIPWAIWRGGSEPRPASEEAPSYVAAGIAALVVFLLYLVTMAPSTAMWDTSEYIAAAHTFGLPHPPGNPFFVIVGHAFSLLPIAPNVAARINVLATLCSALSAGAWFLITERILSRWLDARWLRLTGASVAALIGATAFTVWNQSVVNEKVYTVSLLGIAIVSWLAILWAGRPEGTRADRLLMLMAYLCGLGYANHMAGMLPGPAIAAAVLMRRPSTLYRPRLLLLCAAALLLGLTPFATQPIRAAYFPAMNEGEPTACRTAIGFSCTFSKGTLEAFSYNFNRGQYGKPNLSDRQASYGQQVGMWWLYFKWQWVRDAAAAHPFLQALFAATFLVLGLFGAWTQWRHDRAGFWYLGPFMLTITLILIYYLNFKLGWSQDQGSQAPHEVRDRDYFFLWSFSAWSVWAALGLVFVWETLAASLRSNQEQPSGGVIPATRSWLLASPVLLVALVPLASNWHAASRASHLATRDVAADLLNSVEPYGVLVTAGDNDTFPLWYAQEVEGIRRDVVIACTSLLNTDWYVRQLIRRPVHPYDAAKGPAIYRDKQWAMPKHAPINMTLDEADAIPQYYQLQQPMAFAKGDLNAVIDPKNLEYNVLQRADLFVLRMINDVWPERPIYFARSAGGYPRSLGLENNILTQGLAWKLFVPPANASQMKDTMFVQGDGWLDVARSHTLWTDVFQGQKSLIREGQWVDRASVSMPYLYLIAGAELADALSASGRAPAGKAVMATTTQVAHATQLDGALRGMPEEPKTQSTEPPARKPQ